MHDAFLTLQPVTSSHLQLLERWLGYSHVKPWFPHAAEILTRAANPPDNSQQAILYYRRVPLGYLRWEIVDPAALQALGLEAVPAGAADADIFIGEDSERGQGIGPRALNVMCKRLQTRGDVPMVGLTASIDNKEAHRAFEKAGFSVTAQYQPEGFGDCYLFTRNLAQDS